MPSPVADSAERLEALDPLRSFCVTAPAGSGKTELLIQRYLTLLARVELPQEVLAITFTRKAAAEMRSRIGDALALAESGERPGDDHAAMTFDLARGVLAADSERDWNLRANPSQLNIRTIDGFCGALTRQMPVLSKFGGPIAAVDDAWPYYREATHGLLEQLELKGPGAGDLATLLLLFDNNWSRLEDLLVAMLACRDQWLVTMGTGLDREQAQFAIERSLVVLCTETLSGLDEALQPWRSELEPLWRYARDNLGESGEFQWPGHDTGDVVRWQSLANILLTQKDTWRVAVDKRCGFPAGKGEAADRKQAMADVLTAMAGQVGLLELLREVRHLPTSEPGDAHWENVLACSRLLPLLAAQLLVVFQQHGIVDHTQVSLAALEALGDDEQPTELALSLDYRLKHILVDEFQDTAVNQFELVRRLTRGWAEHNADNPEAARTLFIVGDGMQSIYGFRDADVGLFIRAKQQGFDALALEPLTLKTNFRSRAGVVNWVNRSFAEAFPAADNIQRGEIAFSPAVAFQEGDDDGAVQVVTCDDERVEAGWLAERIREGMDDPDCESIAVLVRRKADLVPLVAVLKSRGIQWQAQEIDALSDSMVVRDLENLCRALHNPLDRVAWLALLRAPWCGLPNPDLLAFARESVASTPRALLETGRVPDSVSEDGRRRLAGLRSALLEIMAQRERLPLRDWIEFAWLRLNGPHCVEDSAQLEDAEAFFNMLSVLEAEKENYDPARLGQHIDKLFARSSASDSKLQLMTLHKAKGLEFDWVFIPNLGHTARGETRPLLLWDEYHAAAGESCFMLAMNDDTQDSASTLYDYLYEQRKNKRRRESTRLLYVGATRAVQRLWLSANLARDEEGGLKPPGNGSLLSTIWPGVESQLQAVEPDTITDASAELTQQDSGLLRLATPLEADIAEAVAAEPNIPEWGSDHFATAVGNLIHLTLERLSERALPDSFETADFESWWRRELRRAGVAESSLEPAVERASSSLSNVLADERGRWLLSPKRESAASELALSCLLPDGRLGEFVIDRTFIADGVRWVVDYKSSVPDSTQSLRDFLAAEEARYRPQLENYARLLAATDDRPVRCALYFTALPHWHELT